jgi:hypothetical protein
LPEAAWRLGLGVNARAFLRGLMPAAGP